MTKPDNEPIAIIGMGCRFPGDASDPQKFWKMLCEGTDAITDSPKSRWDLRRFYDADRDAPGKMYSAKGGFLSEKWEDFDAEFFHISPREADHLDPQQRLLLELTWEAMEDAGVIPENIRGSDTGVYIGGFTSDWNTLQNNPSNMGHCGIYSGINSSKTILSARLSHFFDLKGPCLTLDTACSSSLVAVHLACQNLWQKSSSLAIAGGVNAMLIPETTIAMSKGKFLNPEGYCRSFDESAKGYVRGEGGGVVILKRLSDALKDKDSIYALIRGTGVNHDGYTPGISQPNPEAQKDLIQKVLDESGVDPWQIHYVEAHGTGTPVGDPIEAKALDDVLNVPGKRQAPCVVGAVKTNLGHLEAAAGIAGLIKTALCLKFKKIPPNLHFKKGNPHIPFAQYCLEFPTALKDFLPYEDHFFACVNSFGYGGTNAHAVLQGYQKIEAGHQNSTLTEPLLFPFSSKNQGNLKSIAKTTHEYLAENPEVNLEDLSYTLSRKRSLFDHRLSVSAESTEELKRKLQKIANEEMPEGCVSGKNLGVKPRLAFVYSGMGPQWWGMGRELLRSSPVFLETMKKCDQFLLSHANWSLIEELNKEEIHSRMDDPEVAQVANYALQVSLTALMRSWGIIPDAVVGHSIGEVAAAHATGALSLEEGLLVTFHRSRIQSHRKNLGTMLAVGLGEEECRPFLSKYSGKISIAAVNSGTSVTLAGSKEDLIELESLLDQKNIFTRFLKVNIAYHSHQMEGLEEEVLQSLGGIKPKTPTVPLFSTVFGDACQERILDAHYWWQNIRQPVLFSKTIQHMIASGYQFFIEIGPHPVLSNFIKEKLVQGVILSTLNRKKAEMASLMECLGGLYVNGYPLPWEQLHPSGRQISLPTYTWQKKPYWIESEESKHYRLSARHHPMLSRKVKSPNPTWQVEVNSRHFSWLEDHQIHGTVVFPAAAYVEAGLAAGGVFPCVLENMDFKQVLTIQPGKEAILQISLDEETKSFKVHSLSGSDEWTTHATGKCCSYTLKPTSEPIDFQSFKTLDSIEGSQIYLQFAEKGLEYGPCFRGIKKIWKKDGEALAEIQISKSLESYHLHPALLDSALQTLIGTVTDAVDENIILPCHVDQIIFHHSPADEIYCYAKRTKQTKEKIVGDLYLSDQSGRVSVQIKGLECRLLASHQKVDPYFYEPVWEKKPLSGDIVEGENASIVLNVSDPFSEPHATIEISAVKACVKLVKGLDENSRTLWIVTRGTQGSSLWGLGRVIRQEYPHLRCRLIDLEPSASAENILALEARQPDSNDEISWRKGQRYVLRLKKKELKKENVPLSNFSLHLRTPGLIESLGYEEVEKRSPAKGEVGIRVHSSSLNFKDLMKVLGILDNNALEGTYFGKSFGMECSGTVESIGPGVKNHKIGDRVCCFVPNTFQSYINASAKHVYSIPPGVGLDEAALYIPFITVLRALKQIAKLKKGETILIHSATGAVGLAAIQYAKSVGAKIIATAGSEEKRNYLLQMGVSECADSRSLSFVEDVKKWTDNRGVDVVLNSLSGDALTKSFSLLSPYGRFIEIGKRDISTNTSLPMCEFNRNTLFAAIDLDRTFIDEPKLIQTLLKETDQLFKKGVFTPLPCQSFPANQVIEAFQFMARSKHIGKIMLKFDQETVLGTPLLVKSDASYLVTGGFSGFGLTIARWLAKKGAKHLILVGRSGAKSPEAQKVMKQLKAQGVHVHEAAVDITNKDKLAQVLKGIMPPLKGVIHSAMVLEDALISKLTDQSIEDVLMPKISGCLNLHACTENQPLDFFVLFSSISSIIGNPGQGNYAAANAFLDSFCHYRKKLNLPALTINWGALKLGALARDTKTAKYLEHHGIKGLDAENALKLLEQAILSQENHLCALDVNWKKLLQSMPAIKQSSVFSDFSEESSNVFLGKVPTLDFVSTMLKEMIGKTLKIDPTELDEGTRLNLLGVDSLMAMELHTMIEINLGIMIPSMELMKGPSIKHLAHLIHESSSKCSGTAP